MRFSLSGRVLWLKRLPAAACAAASLAASGCQDLPPPSTALVDGAPAPAPAGWVDYCRRHAEDSGCPR